MRLWSAAGGLWVGLIVHLDVWYLGHVGGNTKERGQRKYTRLHKLLLGPQTIRGGAGGTRDVLTSAPSLKKWLQLNATPGTAVPSSACCRAVARRRTLWSLPDEHKGVHDSLYPHFNTRSQRGIMWRIFRVKHCRGWLEERLRRAYVFKRLLCFSSSQVSDTNYKRKGNFWRIHKQWLCIFYEYFSCVSSQTGPTFEMMQ